MESRYHIKAKNVGSIGNYLKILKEMVSLYEKQYELIDNRRKRGSQLLSGFIVAVLAIMSNVYLVETGHLTTYRLSVVVNIVYFIYIIKTRVKVQKRENNFNKEIKDIDEDSFYPKFYYTGYWNR